MQYIVYTIKFKYKLTLYVSERNNYAGLYLVQCR